MSTLLKWAQQSTGIGKSISMSSNSSSNSTTTSNNSNNANTSTLGLKWIHSSESLQKGHIVYIVKFLGNTVVDQPKGIDVVKDGIRKLQFSQQMKKSETGSSSKMKKVELTISVDGVAIQEPKTHQILYQFPLHRISYCADDKGEKKFFAFIAKNESSVANNNTNNSENHISILNESDNLHECFVFVSDKLAEEITLTIGQAFDLAYKKFLDSSGRDLESQKRLIIFQQQIKKLERENNIYKQRLTDLSHLKGVSNYLQEMKLKNLLEITADDSLVSFSESVSNVANNVQDNMIDINDQLPPAPPVVPPRPDNQTTNLINAFGNDDDFDPRFYEKKDPNANQFHITPPLLAPPPKTVKRPSTTSISNVNEIKSTKTIFLPEQTDLFGMDNFSTNEFENVIGLLDKRILEMQNGFSRGISFGNDDFSLESLDPLKNS